MQSPNKPQVGWPPCRTFYKRSSFRTAILSLAVLLVLAFAVFVFGRRALGMVPRLVVKPWRKKSAEASQRDRLPGSWFCKRRDGAGMGCWWMVVVGHLQLTKASAAATRWACTMRIRCEPQPVCRHRLGAIVEQFPLGKVTSARNFTNVMGFTGLFCRGLHPSMEQTAISAMVRIGSNRTNRTADIICQGETTSPFQIAATRCSSVPGGMLLELELFEPFATSVDCFRRV